MLKPRGSWGKQMIVGSRRDAGQGPVPSTEYVILLMDGLLVMH